MLRVRPIVREYSVIIPSKHLSNLVQCVQALRVKNHNAISRLIIIDDSDSEDIKNYCLENELKRIKGIKPFCYARNCNLGIQSTIDDIILLNDDAILETYLGLDMLALFAQNYAYAKLGLVVPLITGITGSPEQRNYDWRYVSATKMQIAKAAMLSFICVYIPRKVIDLIGLLNEEFEGAKVYGGEDDAYCFRVRQAGFDLGVFQGCVFEHESVPSTFRTNEDGSYKEMPISPAHDIYEKLFGHRPSTFRL